MTTIRTARLLLRPARSDDLDAIHAVLSHPEATRWWSTPPHEDIEQSRTWLEGMIANTAAGAADFVVEYQGRVVGKAGCWKAPEVGYILHPDVWGRGLGNEALAAVIDHVFATKNLDALTADVDPNNAASIRLLERLGFVRTGEAKATWHIGGQWMDSLYYGLERSRWQMRREG
ncbi:GNAT family protein [Brevundimonas sp.]|uniref:GNAT family N-acetyltransferase n=1 Tax=Brevundimonas sp. TaxID=1871086 RepID=UPI00286ABAC3|nr:GNAT family protein [Brevundimonas sp.]